MEDRKSMLMVALMALCAGLMMGGLTSCQTAGGSGLSVEAAGVCSKYVTTAGQEVKVCYHPVTRQVTLSGTYAGRSYQLVSDPKTGTAEGTLPDGTVIRYDPHAAEKLQFVPPPALPK